MCRIGKIHHVHIFPAFRLIQKLRHGNEANPNALHDNGLWTKSLLWVFPRPRVGEWTRALHLRTLQRAEGLGDSFLSSVESVIVRQGEQVETGVDGRCQVGNCSVEQWIAGLRAKGIKREFQVCKGQVLGQEHVSNAAVDVMEVLHLIVHIVAHDVPYKRKAQLSGGISEDHRPR